VLKATPTFLVLSLAAACSTTGEITGAGPESSQVTMPPPDDGSAPPPTSDTPPDPTPPDTTPPETPPPVETAPPAPRHRRCGWIGFGDSIGYAAFAANVSFYDVIHPDWYSVADDSVTFAPRRGVDDARVLGAAKNAGVPVVPLIAAVDDPTPVINMLADDDLRAAHIAGLVAIASRYDGIEIDYEHLPPSKKADFSNFITTLAAKVHAQGKMITVAVYADYEGTSVYDYAKLVAAVDHVHVMGYSHYGTQTLPTAPLGWIEMVLAQVKATGHADKFILGLPNYAFTPTSYCALGECSALCTGPITPSTTVLSDGFDAGGLPSCAVAGGQIVYDDTASLEDKVAAAKSSGLGGITYWSVGREPAGFFTMVKSYY